MNESHHTYPQEEHTAANAKLVVPFGKPPDPNEEVERAIYSHTKEPYIHTQKSPIHSKEPQKPLYTRAAAGFQRRGPCAHSKEPYIHTQKSHIHSKEPQKPRNKGVPAHTPKSEYTFLWSVRRDPFVTGLLWLLHIHSRVHSK